MTGKSSPLLIFGSAVAVVAWSALLGPAFAAEPLCHALPLRAIVAGHNVQPRADQLAALGRPDLTARQAQEVDRLYRELMGRSADS